MRPVDHSPDTILTGSPGVSRIIFAERLRARAVRGVRILFALFRIGWNQHRRLRLTHVGERQSDDIIDHRKLGLPPS